MEMQNKFWKIFSLEINVYTHIIIYKYIKYILFINISYIMFYKQ